MKTDGASRIIGGTSTICLEFIFNSPYNRHYGFGCAVWGKQDRESVEEVLCIALKISFLVSMIFFMASLFLPRVLMQIFTNEMLLIEAGIPYLRIVSWSYLFMGFSQIYLCIMKNSGRTSRSTIYGSSALVLNILLNAILIFGLFGFPQMGIAGAALATTI